jgi:cytochrome c551
MLIALATACSPGPDEDASGSQIYSELCARCHGTDLDGGIGPALGPESRSVSEPDEFLRFTIVNGRGRMPSFESTLDGDQIDRLVAFIREVQSGG